MIRAAATLLTFAFVACGKNDASASGGEAGASAAASMRKKPLAVGDTAPRFAVKSLTGDSLIVGDRNSKVTLLNVWATWCTSCKEEFSELERFRKTFSATGLNVVAVSVDQGSDVKVRKFVEAQGSQFPVAHDAEARISSLYGVNGLPTTYLLDANGKILWTAIGDFRLDSAGMANAIDRALAK